MMKSPFKIWLAIFMLTSIVFGLAVRMVEYPFMQMGRTDWGGIDGVLNGIWFVINTLSTIG